METLKDWLQPGVIIAVVLYVWRDLRQDLKDLGRRIDSHLEGHASK